MFNDVIDNQNDVTASEISALLRFRKEIIRTFGSRYSRMDQVKFVEDSF